MIKKTPSRLFFILALVILLSITYLKHPSLSRQKIFTEFESNLKIGQFNTEKYWQFRERFSPGTFTRNEENISFFSNFRITSVKDEITPLFYYESKYLSSLDALVSANPSDTLNNFKKEFSGEIIADTDSYVLIKENEKKYAFAFIVPASEMQKVNGLFDYRSSERELIKDYNWYNKTWISL